ncbi:bifunctional folylpolyglutamate synthase/dihydrofolate synthase [bacterium]|nr:bifunctional folylpolyglutamate synthase/dihydrofolate synthase [bacterium]
MEYKEFLETLYQRYSGNIKLGLQRMFEILADMDSPHTKLKGLHIAGTNGKGSTCAMLEALCLASKLTTGLNTSPHLVNYTERFRINGNNLDYETIYNEYRKWEGTFNRTDASFFEITTAIAFKLFLDNKVDTAIFEVGLGGRLDGTNPFQSTVTAITSISIDHRKTLGDTIEKIAAEKAGIIKKYVPMVISKLKPSALEVILKVAEENFAPTYIYNKDYFVSNVRISDKGTIFDYSLPELNINFKDIAVNLLGEHQSLNAGVALTSFLLYLQIRGIPVQEDLIRNGLSQVVWSGRMQIINFEPLTILDGAHNDAGMEFLIDNINSIFPNRKKRFVLGILQDKTFKEMLTMAAKIASKLYLCQSNSQRAADVNLLAEVADSLNIEYEKIPDVFEAYHKAIQDADKDDIIIIGGSLYTISEVLAKL